MPPTDDDSSSSEEEQKEKRSRASFEDMDPLDSIRIWKEVNAAIIANDMPAANHAKTKIEVCLLQPSSFSRDLLMSPGGTTSPAPGRG